MCTVEERAINWLINGETGASSKTICAVMLYCVDRKNLSRYDYPHDPSDFRRCKQLLDVIPEWRKKLWKVYEMFPIWHGLVTHWDELEALYIEELPSGVGLKLHARMRELVNSVEGGAA